MSQEATLPAGNVPRPAALEDLPPFRPLALELIRRVSEEEVPTREISELVRRDPAYSAEVLRLANSPVFGIRYEVKDILHAIAVLGMDRLRALIITLAMKEMVRGARQSEVLTLSWRHSLATALATETLAEATWSDQSLAYTAGLLHEVGVLIFLVAHGDQYAEMVRAAADSATLRRHEAEAFSVDHGEAARWLFEDWGLPPVFQRVVADSHIPPAEGQVVDVVGLVYVGSATADMVGFPLTGRAPGWHPAWTLTWFDPAVRERLGRRLADLPLAVATKVNSFDCEFLT